MHAVMQGTEVYQRAQLLLPPMMMYLVRFVYTDWLKYRLRIVEL